MTLLPSHAFSNATSIMQAAWRSTAGSIRQRECSDRLWASLIRSRNWHSKTALGRWAFDLEIRNTHCIFLDLAIFISYEL
jgi:hypothetical protein